MTNINEKAHVKAANATVGLEATEKQQTLSSSKGLKYLEMCIKAHESLTEALVELKVRSK